jgi:hypothetical protein
MDYKELLAYQKAFKLAMEIYDLSKKFPVEEKYSLTDQIEAFVQIWQRLIEKEDTLTISLVN